MSEAFERFDQDWEAQRLDAIHFEPPYDDGTQERITELMTEDFGKDDDEDFCEGHESLNGPIGNVEYCDGTCKWKDHT